MRPKIAGLPVIPRARFVPAHAPSQLPALRQAELALAGQERHVGRRSVQVPADAFATVRFAPPRMREAPLALAAPAPASHPPERNANDNGLPPGAWRRKLIRELLLLAAFALTLVGTYYIGRLSATQHVIVVPEPWSRASRIG